MVVGRDLPVSTCLSWCTAGDVLVYDLIRVGLINSVGRGREGGGGGREL